MTTQKMPTEPIGGKPPEKKQADWRENYAYTMGVQAYLLYFPRVLLSDIRWQWVAKPTTDPLETSAPLNYFYHSRDLITPEWRSGGSPNNDTLYSFAWLDISKEPIILSHGEMDKDRYFAFEFGTMTSDNFAYVSGLSTGHRAGNFMIAKSDWKGELPEGVQWPAQSNGTKLIGATPTSVADFVMLVTRTACKGSKDLAAVHKAQDSYKLTPLSQWGKKEVNIPKNRDVWKPFDKTKDPLADWKTINKALIRNPALDQHKLLVELYKTIGIGPGLDVEKMDDATKRGLRRAAVDGLQLVTDIGRSGSTQKNVNGWKYIPNSMGSAGYYNDFFTMSPIQCMEGLISNDTNEAIYINTHKDINGNKLNGANKYTLTFPKGGLPPVSAFWSLTMYDLTNNLVPNSLKRYNINSLNPSYELAKDGSLTIYLQHDSPGKDKEANWLPAPSGEFWVVFRTYGPTETLINQTWEMPGLELVK